MINLVKKYRPLFIFFILPVIVPLLLFYFYNKFNPEKIELYMIEGETMGTTYSVQIYSKDVDVDKLKNKIESLLIIINKIMSTYDESSELSLINKHNSKIPKSISPELLSVIKESLYISSISEGAYDCTIYPLVNLWSFYLNPHERIDSIPDSLEILASMNRVNYKKIKIIDNMIIKEDENILIDLSSIAKGYAVDEISTMLLDLGYYNHAVEIGGEWYAHGKNQDGDNWNIEIDNFERYSKLFQFDKYLENPVISLDNKAIATSGTYNNYIPIDNKPYPHLINPKSGYPINNNLISATIIADNCMLADGLATMSMILDDPNSSIRIIENQGAEGLIISVDSNGAIVEFFTKNFHNYIVE